MKSITIQTNVRVAATDHPELEPNREALLPKASRIAENFAYNDAFRILDERYLSVGDLTAIELVSDDIRGNDRKRAPVLYARFAVTFDVTERD